MKHTQLLLLLALAATLGGAAGGTLALLWSSEPPPEPPLPLTQAQGRLEYLEQQVYTLEQRLNSPSLDSGALAALEQRFDRRLTALERRAPAEPGSHENPAAPPRPARACAAGRSCASRRGCAWPARSAARKRLSDRAARVKLAGPHEPLWSTKSAPSRSRLCFRPRF